MKSSVLQTALRGLCLVALTLSVVGCANHDENNWQRLVCEVQSVNAGNPLISPYVTIRASEVFQTLDSVMVVFHARPYGSTITLPEDGAHSWFQIRSFDLIWDDVSGRDGLGSVDLPSFNVYGGATSAMVPVNDEAATVILVVGSDMKNSAWFEALGSGAIEAFQTNARLIFYGSETGSDKVVAVATSLRVHFISSLIEN